MSTKPQAKIDLGLNDKPAVAALKAFGDTWSASFSALNQGMEILSKGLSVVTGALGSVVDLGAKAIAAAQVQERAELRLATALKMRGEYTAAGMEGLKAYASSIQAATKHGDEAVLGLQAQLLAMGVHASQLREATKATIGLAEVSGSLEEASKKVARALAGDVGGLKEVGIQATSTADAMRQMTALFALAEADARTYEGRVQQLENAWGDLLETLGFAVTQSTTINRVLEESRVFIEGLNAAVAGSGLGAWLDEVLRKLIDFSDVGLAAIADGLSRVGSVIAYLETKLDTLTTILGTLDDLVKYTSPSILLESVRQLADAMIGPDVRAEDTVFGKAASAMDGARMSLRALERDLQQAPLAAAAAGLGGLDTRFGAGAYGTPGSGGVRPRSGTPRRAGGGAGGGERGQLVPQGFGSSSLGDLPASELASFFGGGVERNQGRTILPSEQVTPGTLTPIASDRAAEIFGLGGLDQARAQLQDFAAEVTDWGTTVASTIQSAMQGLGSAVADTLESAFSGAEASFSKALGTIMVGLGKMLVSTGVASMALGLLSFIPGLQLVTGAPGQAIASGAVVAGVGAGLIAGGVALGGGSAGAVASAPSSPGSGSTSRAPTGFGGVGSLGGGRSESGSTTIIYANFGPGSATNPRRSARELQRAMGAT